MQFSIITLLTGFAAIASAASTDNPFKINGQLSFTAGQPGTIQWTPTTQGPVTLTLRSGANNNLEQGTTIASGIPNSGSYTFTLPADTTRNSDYTIQIAPDNDPSKMNFTPQFVVESKNTVAKTTSGGSSSATSASAASSSGASTSAASSMASSAKSSMSSMKASSTMSGSSSSSSTSSPSSTQSTESAPTNGAASNKGLYVQGGMVAVLMGAAVVL